MKTDVISINNYGGDLSGIFSRTEKAAEEAGLNDTEKLELRLLAEETISLLHSVSGQINAGFWIEWEDKDFTLHLSSRQKLGNIQRNQLISSTTSGANEAAKTFLGKLRDIFEQALCVDNDLTNYYGINGVSFSVDISDEIIESAKWDQYERSILLSVADNVKIGIKGGVVDMSISKKFG